MRIVEAELYRYALPLAAPLRLPKETLAIRTGLILALTGDDGARGYGDIAPLPGFSAEDLTGVTRDAVELQGFLIGREVHDDLLQLNGVFDRWFEGRILAPSLRFGVETAVIQLPAAARHALPSVLLSPTPQSSITINGLLAGTLSEVLGRARELSRQGFRTVKLKVGSGSVEQDIERVHTVDDLLGKQVVLRLDANRAWDLDTALAFARGIAGCAVEYIEEPLLDPVLAPVFYEESGLGVALDESLVECGIERMQELRGVVAVVLKPTLLGGLERTMRLARAAQARRITPVISAAYESGVGIGALVQLAAAVHAEGVAAGLDTYRTMRDDVLVERLPFARDMIDVAHAAACAQHLNTARLEPVPHA